MDEARVLTKHFAKTFYFASLLLPKEKRQAAYAVYAFCRLRVEAADNTVESGRAKALEALSEKLELAYSEATLTEPLLAAFRAAVTKYAIPRQYFQELLEGMRLDLTKTRYSDFNELYTYCHKAAGVVGLIMLKIFGAKNKDAEDLAVRLGIAMQLTNIIRDIKEDFLRGRIYFPQDEMLKYSVSESAIAEGAIDSRFKEFLKFQIARARYYYREAEGGFTMIADMRSALVARLMSRMYEEILREAELNNYDVFNKRAAVSCAKKILITLKTLFRCRT